MRRGKTRTLGVMRAILFGVLCLMPTAVAFGLPLLLAQGADPRGYGPKLVGFLVGVALSAVFALAGVVFTVRRATNRKPWRASAAWSFVTAAPALYLFVSMFAGRA